MAEKKNKEDYYKAVVVDDDGNPVEPNNAQKAKGAAQVVAGTALMGIGVPMLVLPGPGAAAIVGGAAIACKGHRNLTGREALPIEQTIDQAAVQMADAVKEQAKDLGAKAEKKMPEPARRVVFEDAPEAGRRIAAGGKEAARIGTELGKIGVEAAKGALENAPEVSKKVASGAEAAAKAGSTLAKAAKGAIETLRKKK